MRYKVEKKPSNTKGDTWTKSTVQTKYREEFNGYLSPKASDDLALFLKVFWEAVRNEPTYLNDVNIWDLTGEKRREIFLRGYQMWITYKTGIDQLKDV